MTDLDNFEDPNRPWQRVRYLMTFLAASSIVVIFSLRTTLSVAIVAMTNNSTNPNFDTFDWGSSTQGTLLSSFFWGYTITTIPFAMLVARFGTRVILPCSILFSSITTYVMPVAANYHWGALCGLRVVQGVTQAAVFPSMFAILSKWAVPSERGLLVSICYSGVQISSVITLPISGALASGAGGWPSIFYVFGSIGVAWCILWVLFGYDSPSDHPYISKEERLYIESFYAPQHGKKSIRAPWPLILTSLPVWGTFTAQICHTWGFYMLLTEMPTYMNDVLHFDIKQNGLLAALPYIVMLFLMYVYGWASDFVLRNNYLSLRVSRKLFNTISLGCPMATMIGLSLVGVKETELAVALLVLSAGLNSGVCVGYQLNLLELGPRYASILMGISNSLGNMTTIILPLVVGAIVTVKGNEDQWHTVFAITAGMYFIGAVAFLFLGRTETQSWNEEEEEKDVCRALEDDRSSDSNHIDTLVN